MQIDNVFEIFNSQFKVNIWTCILQLWKLFINQHIKACRELNQSPWQYHVATILSSKLWFLHAGETHSSVLTTYSKSILSPSA